jgi:hypothetical protein
LPLAAVRTEPPHEAGGNDVRPVGCTHPTAAPSSPCELRWTASCWPRSRFSARGPGWPACLDHGQGNVEKHAVRNHGSTKHIDDAGTPAPARARRARLGIAAEWRFWQVLGRCELRAVRQRTKSPSPRCSDQVINRKPWKQTQRPSETSPPRSQFIAPGSLRRICGWQRASGGAFSLLYLY